MYLRPHREPHRDAHSKGKAPVRASWVLRVVLALLLLPALLSGGAANARALLRCEVAQTVQATCCCPVKPVASISRSCCCTRVEVESALPDGSLRATSQLVPPLVFALQPGWRGFGCLARTVSAYSAPRLQADFAPPTRSGPSLIVLHRRFLI